MPRFQYTVVSTDGKKLNGTIDAADEKIARRDLNELGFSIMNIQQIDETLQTQEEGTIIFEFEAFDKKGKKVVGTIPATDKYAAFKRLKTEYEFNILNIVKGAAASYEKEQEKKQGVAGLEEQLRQEIETTSNSVKNPLGDTSMQGQAAIQEELKTEEAQILENQINFVLQKVTEIMNKYGNDIEQEARDKINQQVNRLLRIKSSTNLEYVRSTCEELLQTVQKQEVLMVNQENDFEKSKLKFDVEKMLNEIHQKEANISWREDKIRKLDSFLSHNEITNHTPFFLKLKIEIAQWLLSLIKESEKIRGLRQKTYTVSSQIKDYMKMYLKEESPEIKTQIKANIGALLEKRKILKSQISLEQKIEREHELAGLPENFMTTLLKEIYTFTGWLLAFYLVYYFISIYISTKNFGFGEIPGSFHVYDSTFFKYILVILFIAHSSISMKINFFKNSTSASIVLFPSTLIIIMLIMFNL